MKARWEVAELRNLRREQETASPSITQRNTCSMYSSAVLGDNMLVADGCGEPKKGGGKHIVLVVFSVDCTPLLLLLDVAAVCVQYEPQRLENRCEIGYYDV